MSGGRQCDDRAPLANSEYDDIYIKGYETMRELYEGLKAFFKKYNHRNHQGLDMSPTEKYFGSSQLEIAA